MKILLTGSTGQLGHVLAKELSKQHQIIAPLHSELDLSNANTIRQFIATTQPDLIINPAAYTAVDKAESETELAYLINAEAPKVLAQEAQTRNIGLIHFSTDYVFDGEATTPYHEDSPPAPANVYGQSKLAGEREIAAHCERYWIFRTSWVYGAHGNNFLKTILKLAQERDTLNIVNDQWGAPTSTKTISDALKDLIASPDLAERLRLTQGIYHLTANGATTWHAYACTIVQTLRELNYATKIEEKNIIGVPSSAYPTAAKRPKNSRLCLDKFTGEFGLQLPHWSAPIKECLIELTGSPLKEPSVAPLATDKKIGN